MGDDARGVALYRRLVSRPAHVAAALSMMAHWDLAPLARALPSLPVPLALLVGERDLTVPPWHGERVLARVPQATLIRLPGLGHLAHEEAPGEVVADESRAACNQNL